MPALGVPGVLERLGDRSAWVEVGAGTTDADGRIGQLNGEPVAPGDFRITLDTADYFRRRSGRSSIRRSCVNVRLDGVRPHYHLPVLASTFSYSTLPGQLNRSQRRIDAARPFTRTSEIVTPPSCSTVTMTCHSLAPSVTARTSDE